MVDNVAVTAGSGTTIAADDIGAGVLAQRVKPVWGPDGTGNDVDVASGKPMPVQVRSATGLIPIGEPTDAKNTATDTTSVSGISIWKQISASVQAAAASLGGTLTVASHAVTNAGTFAVQATLTAGSLLLGKVGIDQTTPGTTDSVTVATAQGAGAVIGAKADAKSTATDTTSISLMSVFKQISASVQVLVTALGSTAFDLGQGTGGSRTLRVAVDSAQLDGSKYETVAASQTTQAMGATGAAGDYFRELLVIPATTSPGAITIKDGSNSAITVFTGGASSVSNLVPFTISLGLISTSGAWQVTTGANVSAVGIGNFT